MSYIITCAVIHILAQYTINQALVFGLEECETKQYFCNFGHMVFSYVYPFLLIDVFYMTKIVCENSQGQHIFRMSSKSLSVSNWSCKSCIDIWLSPFFLHTKHCHQFPTQCRNKPSLIPTALLQLHIKYI